MQNLRCKLLRTSKNSTTTKSFSKDEKFIDPSKVMILFEFETLRILIYTVNLSYRIKILHHLFHLQVKIDFSILIKLHEIKIQKQLHFRF